MRISTLFPFKGIKRVGLLALLFVTTLGFAQSDRYTITFQDETKVMPENIATFQWSDLPDYASFDNGYIGWIQFYETPTQSVQDSFKANGLDLIDYIPHHTYLFHFPSTTSIEFLRNSGVRSIVPVEGRFKLEKDLKNRIYPDYAVRGNDLLVTIQYHKNVSENYVINQLAAEQISVVAQYDGSNNIDMAIPNNCLEDLALLPYVKWVEYVVAPSVKDDSRGRSLHRASALDTQTASGRNYTGEGVGVMCRDDGAVGNHIDYQGRAYGAVGNGGGTHGDGVSGIMAGAGNLNPEYRGMAAGADLHIVNYVPNFLDNATTSRISDGTVQITNSSYSNGCNAGYTSITETVDEQSIDHPAVMHVFSAGNSNNNNCGYGAGSQWGNITGGHKQGKNVIATANVFYDGVLVNSSSRGPAHDGRIKPDIAANGQNQISTGPNNTYFSFGGTSGAAPGIAGISAQLYQAYMEANGGNMPNSGLIKAALLNTANDYGNVGPDFKFGWGIVNALRAGILIEDGRHLTDNVTQGNSNTHTINVPAGTAQVRFMVYWNDPAATPGANPALINDLDLEVTDPSSNTYEPWILDSTPNATALDTPATTGIDRLNNMEQVLINAPEAGDYDIDITGFNVPVGPQEYYVVYEIIEDNLTLTYPNGSEKLRAGRNVPVHWDAVDTTADFLVEYSDDNGSTWNMIATVGSDEYFVDWFTPTDFTGEALVRVTSGSFSDVSDDTFSISTFPSGVSVTRVCEGEFSLEWFEVTGAESYDVYFLGDKYMEVVASDVTALEATVPVSDINDEVWYAVSAKNATEGWESLRSVAKRHAGGALNCVLGVDDVTLSSSIRLYPNPANDQVFIDFGNLNVGSAQIEVVNSLGQTLTTLNTEGMNGNTMPVNISSYSTGLYFITIETDGVSTTKKLLVQ